MTKFLFLVLGCLSVGCANRMVNSEPEATLKLSIESSKVTNDGTPFYVLLQFTDFPHFLVDNYDTMATIASKAVEEQSCLSLFIIPGNSKKVEIHPMPGKLPAIYCLFTQAGEPWKQLLEVPDGSTNINVVLGDHAISAIETW